PATPDIYTLSLHDALPILPCRQLATHPGVLCAVSGEQEQHPAASSATGRPEYHPVPHTRCTRRPDRRGGKPAELIDGVVSIPGRSEEHTSELQSPCNLVCR